jgi:hypothetical protein
MTEEPKRQDKDAQESEENNRWNKIKGFFLDNPTLTLTLLYLYVTAVGMLYSAVLYGRLGINIFDYSEIPDFLLAAFKNPIVLLVTGIQVVLSYLFAYMTSLTLRSHLESNRERGYEARREGSLLESVRPMVIATTHVWAIVLSGVAFLAVIYFFAVATASSIKNGEKPAVEVRYRSFSGSAGQVTVPRLEFIGATQRAAFFYDVNDKDNEKDDHTLVIPQSQIISIEVPE